MNQVQNDYSTHDQAHDPRTLQVGDSDVLYQEIRVGSVDLLKLERQMHILMLINVTLMTILLTLIFA